MTQQQASFSECDSSRDSTALISHHHTRLLYVDRASRRWIVRDANGVYWALPHLENPWRHRVPYQLTADADLEPVPGHYKTILGIPL